MSDKQQGQPTPPSDFEIYTAIFRVVREAATLYQLTVEIYSHGWIISKNGDALGRGSDMTSLTSFIEGYAACKKEHVDIVWAAKKMFTRIANADADDTGLTGPEAIGMDNMTWNRICEVMHQEEEE